MRDAERRTRAGHGQVGIAIDQIARVVIDGKAAFVYRRQLRKILVGIDALAVHIVQIENRLYAGGKAGVLHAAKAHDRPALLIRRAQENTLVGRGVVIPLLCRCGDIPNSKLIVRAHSDRCIVQHRFIICGRCTVDAGLCTGRPVAGDRIGVDNIGGVPYMVIAGLKQTDHGFEHNIGIRQRGQLEFQCGAHLAL